MEFFVYSRPAVEAGPPHDVPHVIISINCPGEQPARIRTNELTLGRSNHFFWDLDAHPSGSNQETCPLITEEDAVKIIDLVDAHPTAQRVIVHCTAGKSRSAAVAAALMYCYTGDDSGIFGNARYKPNMLVYRTIINAWMVKHT